MMRRLMSTSSFNQEHDDNNNNSNNSNKNESSGSKCRRRRSSFVVEELDSLSSSSSSTSSSSSSSCSPRSSMTSMRKSSSTVVEILSAANKIDDDDEAEIEEEEDEYMPGGERRSSLAVMKDLYHDHHTRIDNDDDDHCKAPLLTTATTSKSCSYLWRITIVFLSLTMVLCGSLSRFSGTTSSDGIDVANRRPKSASSSATTVYVSGGGFSGFWYVLGRLHSSTASGNNSSVFDHLQQQEDDKEYYCYSAGCLVVMSILLNSTMEETYDMANNIQKRWKDGELGLYEVAPTFIDDLIGNSRPRYMNDDVMMNVEDNVMMMDTSISSSLSSIISRIHILTSKWDYTGGYLPQLVSVTTTPSNVDELRTLLIQTSWIPYATGYGLSYDDQFDGAFTIPQHPTSSCCNYKVGLAADIQLLLHTLNVNLSYDMVKRFYELGLEHGL